MLNAQDTSISPSDYRRQTDRRMKYSFAGKTGTEISRRSVLDYSNGGMKKKAKKIHGMAAKETADLDRITLKDIFNLGRICEISLPLKSNFVGLMISLLSCQD